MDLASLFLAVVLAGLSAVLAGIGGIAAGRYGDARLALVSGALALVAVVGLLGVLNQVSPLYGGSFGGDPVPLAVLLVAVVLLYLALVRGGPPRPAS